ncbi:hypothetical protein CKM354_001127100 [Cercospora kikuchii]|uniref:Uncharacterized protein n=1 Tax=Cercospora kikuchii TaxID=84275 RepID=A0A9P3CTA1_9PEZI|nr:uncharacterized protein CKM354_001127100 [Cercospora kikuchii]GIZ48201.1 hypothetical protein CKM354_001127100 [Cercospora kikuchii]
MRNTSSKKTISPGATMTLTPSCKSTAAEGTTPLADPTPANHAPTMNSSAGPSSHRLTSSQSDLWMLQNLHRLAIHSGTERKAQESVLNAFWSKLLNYQHLEAQHVQLRESHAYLSAHCAEKERHIQALRLQVAQNGAERDIFKALAKIRDRIGGFPADHSVRENSGPRLTDQLHRSRGETAEALRQFGVLRWQSDRALAQMDKMLQSISSVTVWLEGQSGDIQSKSPRGRKRKRTDENSDQ